MFHCHGGWLAVKILSLSMGVKPLVKASNTMNVEEPLLVTDEPVGVQDFRKITHHFCMNIYKTHLKLIR